MEKTKRSMWKTISLSVKDTFSAMPLITTATMLMQLVSAGISVAMVALTAKLIDTAGTIEDNPKPLLTIAVLMVGCYLVNILCEKISYRINNIDAVPKFEVFHHRLSEFTVSLSLEAAEDPKISNMFWRAKDAVYQDRMGSVFQSVFGLIPSVFRILGTAAVLYTYHPLLVPLALLSIVPSFMIRLIYGQKRYELHKKQTEKARLGSYLWELLTKKDSIKEMRAMGFSEYLTEKYFGVQNEVLEENKRFSLKSNFRIFLCDFVKIFFYAVSIAFCVYLLNASLITVGAFSACLGAFTTVQSVASGLLASVSGIKNQCNYANDYYDFFELKTEDTHTEKCKGFHREIKLENLTFRYPKASSNAIDGIDLTIKKGEKIAIVGENGSGKTTLSKLLLGLYTPTDGKVLMDDADIRNMDESYYDHFALVAQRFGRYNMTLRDNLAFSKFSDEQNDEKLKNALNTVGISEFADELGGLDTELGVEFGGKELSGGQWQKLALARGVFRDADVLLLDEPTSALDPVVEYDVLSQFIKLAEEKTALIISHRIGICRIADKVIVMKNGKVAEFGSHDELLRAGGTYANMWHEQAKWYATA